MTDADVEARAANVSEGDLHDTEYSVDSFR